MNDPAPLAEDPAELIATPTPAPSREMVTMGFQSGAGFDQLQRVAKCFAASTMVPKEFVGNVANCIIALNMAQRLGRDPLMVMQSLFIVNGRPGWSAQFLIALFNDHGAFSPIRWRECGSLDDIDSMGAVAFTFDSQGECLESAEVNIAMAKAEGWFGKNGSKWPTMPRQMLRYRSATMLIKAFAPGIAFGLDVDE